MSEDNGPGGQLERRTHCWGYKSPWETGLTAFCFGRKCCPDWQWDSPFSNMLWPSPCFYPHLQKRLHSAQALGRGDGERPQRMSRARHPVWVCVGILANKTTILSAIMWQCKSAKRASFLSLHASCILQGEKGDLDDRQDKLISIFLEAWRTVTRGEGRVC